MYFKVTGLDVVVLIYVTHNKDKWGEGGGEI
jgi:hypothetical protein